MKLRVIAFLALVLFFGNFENYRELTDLAIVSAIAVDKTENGLYEVSVQVVNSKKSGGGKEEGSNGSEIIIYSESASTIQEALRLITRQSPKKLYLANLGLLVVSEDVARDGLKNVLDFFLRNTDVNNEFTIIMASNEDKAKEIISVLTPLEKNPTLSIKNSLETVEREEASAVCIVASDAFNKIMSEYRDILITSVKIYGNKEKGKEAEDIKTSTVETKVIISDVGYFEDGKFKGYLTKNDVVAYNMISNNLKNAIIGAKVNGVDAAFEIINSKSKVNVSMVEGSFLVDLSVSINANLSEIKGNINTNDINSLELLRKSLKSKIEQIIDMYLNNMLKTYKVDISGFGDKLYKKYCSNFSENSYGYLSKLKFKVSVDVLMENEGSELILR